MGALARASAAALTISISACAAPDDNATDRDEDESERGDDDEQDGDDDEREDPVPSKADAAARADSGRGKDASAASTEKDSGAGPTEGAARPADAGNARADGGHGEGASSGSEDGDALEGNEPDSERGDSPCAGGRTLLASDAVGGTPVSGNAMVQFRPALSTQIVELKTTLTVPEKPTSSSTLYAWPGLEPWPGGDNFEPAGQGVLQPVLTWGTSCGTYAPQRPTGWWISPQYVNPYTSDRDFYGCKGGKYIDVQVGDQLDITMSLQGTVWSQLVVDRQTGQMTSFDMDLAGQAQNWALFEIEMPTQNRPVSDVIFTSTTLTFADPDAMACQPSGRGASDYFTAPQSSPDGTKCCIDKIVLRARGVPATTPNAP